MRTIDRTSRFKKDYKREARGHHQSTLDADLLAVLSLLIADAPLPERLRDHALTGAWKDHRLPYQTRPLLDLSIAGCQDASAGEAWIA
jgi:addiction module RelE/StbE family toxin